MLVIILSHSNPPLPACEDAKRDSKLPEGATCCQKPYIALSVFFSIFPIYPQYIPYITPIYPLHIPYTTPTRRPELQEDAGSIACWDPGDAKDPAPPHRAAARSIKLCNLDIGCFHVLPRILTFTASHLGTSVSNSNCAWSGLRTLAFEAGDQQVQNHLHASIPRVNLDGDPDCQGSHFKEPG